ncbi:MAG: hypothetical protein A2900_01405 [Candidatus Chisholmbacteria bacterium RIFCSPLOWO2_01_FULL_50_28]|uniref:Uncharacterized protein n=1 Tax=Candidatus Chisholmbacteria bacterium RIFCSPHIGHO2_01_FULL_52_32 TaxID=1797591 RepID=A0A1G1VTY0_9BACT|nr:MAG: hypothetical protein A2786_05335 [Candidatus Chisholmbacteria bacterium RIFCSPHIGHO2_01_FULL_52_32]OGY19746.1 MAG: hypothetical protein A2900_01405 [Candidatus Chisholmbacteria bacterium RIFCSPLOWO2_01_FULL_50_28]
MAARKPTIDLLSREDLSQRPVGRLLLWILTVGRYIVIFSELVVISGFIIRVILDRNLNSINEDLLRQKAILASYLPTEQRVRRAAQQFATISRIEQEQQDLGKLLEKIGQVSPKDLRFSNLSLDPRTMEISAVALSPSGFSTFLGNLQADPGIGDLILQSVESGTAQDPGIHFRLTVEFVGAPSLLQTQPPPTEEEQL